MVNLAVATIDRVGVPTARSSSSTTAPPTARRTCSPSSPRASRCCAVVTHERNRGYGGALLSGFASADEAVGLLHRRRRAVRSRRARAARRSTRPTTSTSCRATSSAAPTTSLRRVIGRVYHRFVAFLFGLKIRDTDCDFRLIRKAALDRIKLEHTTGVICVELVRKLQDAGARFTEVGVHHYPRVHGQSEFFRLSARRPHALGPRRAVGRAGRAPPRPRAALSLAGSARESRPRATDVPTGTSWRREPARARRAARRREHAVERARARRRSPRPAVAWPDADPVDGRQHRRRAARGTSRRTSRARTGARRASASSASSARR